MIKKNLTWIAFAIACSIAVLVSVSALASDGQAIVNAGKHCAPGNGVSGGLNLHDATEKRYLI